MLTGTIRQWEFDLGGYGRTFPHKFSTTDNKYFSTYLTVSPAGDELTLEFAKAAIDAEQIGHDDITDFLGVSFSATDYIGHFFGTIEPGIGRQYSAARPHTG